MMLGAAILVVAPQTILRRSIGVLLESEGWQVGLLELLPRHPETVNGFDCIVVDETALPGGAGSDQGRGHDPLLHLRQPIVLLGGERGRFGRGGWICRVEKPLSAPSLVEAVRTSLSR